MNTHRHLSPSLVPRYSCTYLARKLIPWQQQHGRRGLPWQRTRDAYCIWVSEVMLQQTRVATVIPYYERFMRRFPELATLARAPLDEVLHLWSGLGYYARARNMHKTAQMIMMHGTHAAHASRDDAAVTTAVAITLPTDFDALRALPGIGRSTAAAILALSCGAPYPILDGNARRVLSRFYAVHSTLGSAVSQQLLWKLATRNTPGASATVALAKTNDTSAASASTACARDVTHYTQGIMDLGATVCLRRAPLCMQCPLAKRCRAHRHNLQDQLPASHKHRVLPVKLVCMAIVRDAQGHVLLERRPPTGLWGGLWVLPECGVGDDVGAFVEKRYGLVTEVVPVAKISCASPSSSPPLLRHAFTHFVLEIRPIYMRVVKSSTRVMEHRPIVWYNLAKPPRLGVAAPVFKLLAVLA